MKKHLNEEELLALVSGERNKADSPHLAECPECHREVEQLSRVLGGFRASTREWAEQERRAIGARPPARSRVWSGQGLRLATAVAMLLLCFGVFIARYKGQPAVATVTTTAADDAVLERLDAAMSRSVPSAMEPLSALVPTELQEKSGDAN